MLRRFLLRIYVIEKHLLSIVNIRGTFVRGATWDTRIRREESNRISGNENKYSDPF